MPKEKSQLLEMKCLPVSLVIMVLLLLVSACAKSPLGRRQLTLLPEGQMTQMGADAFSKLKAESTLSDRKDQQTYVQCIARPLILSMEGGNPAEWEILVFKDDSANAFALPGKKIGFHTGMFAIAKTPEQAAAVVGHEIGHVIARHGNERISQALTVNGVLVVTDALLDLNGPKRQLLLGALGLGAQFGVILPFSRTHESEADAIGIRLMAQAGFDPRGAIELWENMASSSHGQPPEFMSTHPSHSTRIEKLKRDLPAAQTAFNAVPEALRPRCVPPKP